MSEHRQRTWRHAAGIALAIFLLAGVALFFLVRQRIPPGFARDVRAGVAARDIQDADGRLRKYLELRYGPMSDPANRKQAFLDYFNVDHIKALQLMVQHSPADQRAANILATARWVENYRNSLTGQERAALRAQLQSPEGVAMLQRATAQYNSQDVRYRGETATVISQLLRTLHSLQTP